MFEIAILIMAGIIFLGTVIALCVMIKEFSFMKSAYLLMENAFRDHTEMTENMRVGVTRGLEGAEVQYNSIQDDLSKVMDSNNNLQEKINQLDRDRKKPMAPDVTLN